MGINPQHKFSGRNQGINNDLSTLFKPEVVSWINSDIKMLIMDYLAIKEFSKVHCIDNLSDYSYLITPAFKSLEGTLIQIGRGLKLEPEKYNFRIGVVFSDKNLEKFFNDVLKKLKGIEKEYKIDIQMWLNDATRILRHYRHSPAHFLGEKKENWDVAFSLGDNILRIINEMCYTLIRSDIFIKLNERK